MNKSLRFSLTSLLLIASGLTQADPGQFYLAPGVQWMNFAEDTRLENDWGFSAGLGYQLTERFSVELGYFDLDPDHPSGTEIDIDHYRLDGLYDIGGNLGAWQPFVVGGVGNTKFEGDNDSILNVGAGLRLELGENLEWRTAVRRYQYLGRDLEDVDWGIDTALLLYFGFGNETRPIAEPATRQESRATASTTPARSNATSDASAPSEAAIADADRDGVADGDDDCPNTPMNYAVDANGCPIPVEEVARVELLVNFDFDRSEVKPEYLDEIEEVTDFMEQYPDVIVELEGHTDSRGAEQYNLGLSDRRANAVRQVMIDRFGISAGRITARGFGESQPVASNDTDSGRARNRRVVTVIIKTLQDYRPR